VILQIVKCGYGIGLLHYIKFVHVIIRRPSMTKSVWGCIIIIIIHEFYRNASLETKLQGRVLNVTFVTVICERSLVE